MPYYKLPKKRYILKRPPIGSDGSVVLPDGVVVLQGNWDASTNLFPSTSVKKGYAYFNTANSTTIEMPDGGIIPEGVMIIAKQDDPGQTSTNWYFLLTVV